MRKDGEENLTFTLHIEGKMDSCSSGPLTLRAWITRMDRGAWVGRDVKKRNITKSEKE